MKYLPTLTLLLHLNWPRIIYNLQGNWRQYRRTQGKRKPGSGPSLTSKVCHKCWGFQCACAASQRRTPSLFSAQYRVSFVFRVLFGCVRCGFSFRVDFSGVIFWEEVCAFIIASVRHYPWLVSNKCIMGKCRWTRFAHNIELYNCVVVGDKMEAVCGARMLCAPPCVGWRPKCFVLKCTWCTCYIVIYIYCFALSCCTQTKITTKTGVICKVLYTFINSTQE